MAQQYKLGKTATTVRQEGDKTIVRYHSTDIVTFDSKSIELNTGGWKTATTKTRMNQASNQFDLGFCVYQEKYQWYINIEGRKLEFEDSIFRLRRNKGVLTEV